MRSICDKFGLAVLANLRNNDGHVVFKKVKKYQGSHILHYEVECGSVKVSVEKYADKLIYQLSTKRAHNDGESHFGSMQWFIGDEIPTFVFDEDENKYHLMKIVSAVSDDVSLPRGDVAYETVEFLRGPYMRALCEELYGEISDDDIEMAEKERDKLMLLLTVNS